MGSMSYCKYQNTLGDLRDCYEDMEDEPSAKEEKTARATLIRLCERIANEYGGDD